MQSDNIQRMMQALVSHLFTYITSVIVHCTVSLSYLQTFYRNRSYNIPQTLDLKVPYTSYWHGPHSRKINLSISPHKQLKLAKIIAKATQAASGNSAKCKWSCNNCDIKVWIFNCFFQWVYIPFEPFRLWNDVLALHHWNFESCVNVKAFFRH